MAVRFMSANSFMINFKEDWDETEEIPEEKNVKPRRKHHLIVKIVWLIVVLAIIFTSKMIISGSGDDSWFSRNIINKLSHIIPTDDKQLIGEEYDRINILLIGIGGKNHDGGYLADTIMLASFKPSTKQVALLSIPRDLAVPNLTGGSSSKINSIHAYAENKEAGSGGPAMTAALSELLDTPIHYYIRVDFEGFINIIDHLGGITVNVERTLDDYAYPIMGQEDNPDYYSRFEHLHVDTGPQKMNGSLALKFARSRYGVGGEGNDFARARRQQLILKATKDRLLSANVLLNPGRLIDISNELSEHLVTNLDISEGLSLWKEFKNIDTTTIINRVLDNSREGLLTDQIGYNGAYLLVPRAGDFSEIKDLATEIFGPEPEEATSLDTVIIPENTSTPIEPLNRPVRLTVLNGTWISGLAGKTATVLNTYGFTATASNSSNREIKDSRIYDLSYGQEDDALKLLETVTPATLAYDVPGWLENFKSTGSDARLILILGTDASNWSLETYKK